jgi:hypothetical protein
MRTQNPAMQYAHCWALAVQSTVFISSVDVAGQIFLVKRYFVACEI